MPRIQHSLTSLLITLLATAAMATPTTFEATLETRAARWVGTPYQLGPLGEGPRAHIDSKPLYRTDAFDCETFITTVLAQSLASKQHSTLYWMLHLRYRTPDHPSYFARNHFPSLDWNPNARALGLILDITTQLKNPHGQPYATFAQARIDKLSWFKQHLPAQALTSSALSAAGALSPKHVTLTYIPLKAFLNKSGKLNHTLLRQLPSIMIVEYVRDHWVPAPHFGTHMLVSHMGFLIHSEKKGWFIREASSLKHGVSDTAWLTTLKRLALQDTVVGFHLERPIKPKE